MGFLHLNRKFLNCHPRFIAIETCHRQVSTAVCVRALRFLLRIICNGSYDVAMPLQMAPAQLHQPAMVIVSTIPLPNQELSVLYGGPTLNYEEQLSLYVPYMLRVSMTGDLVHLQLSYLQCETRPICRTSNLQGEWMLICRT